MLHRHSRGYSDDDATITWAHQCHEPRVGCKSGCSDVKCHAAIAAVVSAMPRSRGRNSRCNDGCRERMQNGSCNAADRWYEQSSAEHRWPRGRMRSLVRAMQALQRERATDEGLREAQVRAEQHVTRLSTCSRQPPDVASVVLLTARRASCHLHPPCTAAVDTNNVRDHCPMLDTDSLHSIRAI
ncbi:hypothetical protein BDZ97DRAFT_1811690 [Flammula alnicola]|nr:hypothetical protein BDZ97DRAFT_1898752 [Flammula alnicola]KAF8954656.1 hypothetical protein BDZ97DRAFT_1863553 [Flammula alnicola]KAF8965658.1 hypothetical protein BDZ97DRAFT_1811690 [Flammula alnicola]